MPVAVILFLIMFALAPRDAALKEAEEMFRRALAISPGDATAKRIRNASRN